MLWFSISKIIDIDNAVRRCLNSIRADSRCSLLYTMFWCLYRLQRGVLCGNFGLCFVRSRMCRILYPWRQRRPSRFGCAVNSFKPTAKVLWKCSAWTWRECWRFLWSAAKRNVICFGRRSAVLWRFNIFLFHEGSAASWRVLWRCSIVSRETC